jgi:hypothetical protein
MKAPLKDRTYLFLSFQLAVEKTTSAAVAKTYGRECGRKRPGNDHAQLPINAVT